jgi:hypothetical protein
MKKCQPGTFCIENMTLVVVLICFIGFGYYLFYYKPIQSVNQREVVFIQQPQIQTNYSPNHNSSYHQVGILTPLNGKETNNILPLMGKQLDNRRGLWNYYTISNQHNNVKLPITVRGKSAVSERGVDEINNGDSVFVEGVFDAYKATIYDNETIRYMP